MWIDRLSFVWIKANGVRNVYYERYSGGYRKNNFRYYTATIQL